LHRVVSRMWSSKRSDLPHSERGIAAARWRPALVVMSVAGTLAVVIGLSIISLGPPPLGGVDVSTAVLDREGRLLRAYAAPDGRWRLPAQVKDVDPRYLDMLLAYEDKRFRWHAGIDLFAFGRAIVQLVRNGRIVSGGSTLTMQVARLLEPRVERSLLAKLRQTVRAIEIERVLNKNEVLARYLTLAPFGGNLEGVRAASLSYFGKEPRRLTLGEAALLIALPQSPEARRPDRSVAAAKAARDRVLDRVSGLFPAEEIERAKMEPIPAGRKPMPMLAPHAADAAIAELPAAREHRLTIDSALQKSLEELARDRALAPGAETSVAILVVDNASGEELAHVGAASYFDQRRSGQVDMTQALRSPGSTLKPFVYGLGFEDGFIHPETLVDDRPIRYGNYAPENFDLTFQGTVSVRRALQMSLNVPAVAVLDKVGASRFTARLAQAGGELVLPKGEVPGLAMGLGGVGVRLSDLVMLYAGLARLGTTLPLTTRCETGLPSRPRRLMDSVAAWYVGNVLLGTPPPENAVGGRFAYKTGTSYGYRDAWALGFDGKRTIGVWVGRPDGAPVPGLVGRTAAAPILFDAFARLGKPIAPLLPAPKGAIFASNARLPLQLQRFRPGGLPSETAQPAPHILFPPNGASLELSSSGGVKADPVALKIAGGVEPLTVLVNGIPLANHTDKRTLFFAPDGPGFVRLTVLDATGKADSVVVRLQ
jgi:penicillin-binding protein 1C